MLCWLGALRNCWTGHTVSAGLSAEELEVRFGAIERFISFGIPSMVWLVTHPTWDNRAVLERALALAQVTPDRIIEAPYRLGTERQELPLLGVDPRGACSDHRTGPDGEEYQVRWERGSADGQARARLLDEYGREPRTPAHSKCRGCALLCGLNVLFPRKASRRSPG
jgi:hypothetical protein